MWAVFPGEEKKKKEEKTINILNQFRSKNLPPPEPMGGLFKCKIYCTKTERGLETKSL